jgi:hypothetical protein
VHGRVGDLGEWGYVGGEIRVGEPHSNILESAMDCDGNPTTSEGVRSLVDLLVGRLSDRWTSEEESVKVGVVLSHGGHSVSSSLDLGHRFSYADVLTPRHDSEPKAFLCSLHSLLPLGLGLLHRFFRLGLNLLCGFRSPFNNSVDDFRGCILHDFSKVVDDAT